MKHGKQIIAWLLLFMLLQPASGVQGAEQDVGKSVVAGSQTLTISAGKRTVQFVKINRNDPRLEVRPVLAHGQVGKTQSLQGMAQQHGALAAINGTFFMAYNEGEHKPPWGLIVIDYEKKNDGTSGASIGLNPNSLPVIATTKLMEADQFEHVISAGPTLVQDGKIVVNPLAEGMTDPKLTTLSGQRSFIGYTPDNHLLMGTVPNVTLPQLAEICQAMGMTAAMNLDGGASSGLYAHGKLLTRPGRELSNAIVVATRKTEPIQVKWGERQLAFTRGPLLIQGSLYVPAVEILEQLGAQVAVQQQEKELLATWQGKEFRLSERGRLSSSADGTVSHVPTRKIDGVQMVSLRSIVEVLGMRVEWDPQARTAVIFSQSSGIK